MKLINFTPQFKILILLLLCTFNRFFFSFCSFYILCSFACELKTEQHESEESYLKRFFSSDLSLSLEHFGLSAGLLKFNLICPLWLSREDKGHVTQKVFFVAQKVQQNAKASTELVLKQKPVGGGSNAPHCRTTA